LIATIAGTFSLFPLLFQTAGTFKAIPLGDLVLTMLILRRNTSQANL
jgi:hypothetical protein